MSRPPAKEMKSARCAVYTVYYFYTSSRISCVPRPIIHIVHYLLPYCGTLGNCEDGPICAGHCLSCCVVVFRLSLQSILDYNSGRSAVFTLDG